MKGGEYFELFDRIIGFLFNQIMNSLSRTVLMYGTGNSGADANYLKEFGDPGKRGNDIATPPPPPQAPLKRNYPRTLAFEFPGFDLTHKEVKTEIERKLEYVKGMNDKGN